MAPEDLVFVIELKLMWFARDLDYGNTGCGVFKWGVPN